MGHVRLNEGRDFNRVLENVASEGKTRREKAKEWNLQIVNEHLEHLSNAVLSSGVVLQHPVNA
jgi:hypothetical protein